MAAITARRRSAAALAAALVAVLASVAPAPPAAAQRPRVRELGLEPGVLAPGRLNTITDVAGVRVGHRTIIEGESIRTGVTAVLPHGGNLFQDKVPAAVWVGNGFGKAAGFLQVEELGTLESPIVLTNTLAVGTVVAAVVDWTLARPGNEEVRSVNAVVGETNDGYLNDIRTRAVTARHVVEAIAAAREGPVAEGSVGAGTGTRALGYKGGIGTASRVLPAGLGGWSVGALVQSNFGGVLMVDGVPVGEALGGYPFREEVEDEPRDRPGADSAAEATSGDGSCMIVLATDAPLSARNLRRLARRAVLALGRVGSFISNGSGDFVIAFSTARRIPYQPAAPVASIEELHNHAMSPLFLAAVEAVEEAIYNSLLQATSVTGHQGRTVEAIPVDELRLLLARYGRGE